jgi:hydrocephalus-inducing protein
VVLRNVSAIPMPFVWRMAEDNPPTKQVTCVPARGEILPMGTQTVTVDFLPTNIMRYDFNLLLDMPGIQEGAARLPLTAECAVPLVALEEPQLSFGKCFLGYPYQQQFRLINESRLPAQFEVLTQVRQ